MEREGAPNAGLWDQRAVMEWIKSYGNLFGGDTGNVSVWGESAGAGSITHHLTAFGGKKESLFNRAVIQSSAFDSQVDRRGQLEKQFKDFAAFAGCTEKEMSCLRAADLKTIKDAQDKYIKMMPGGKPGFGPAADGDFVRQLPVLELASGKSCLQLRDGCYSQYLRKCCTRHQVNNQLPCH
jgi:carboxylesterase type B